MQQRLRFAAVDPVGKAGLPFLQRQAPLRVARHDVAGTPAEAAAIEQAIGAVGEDQQPCPLGFATDKDDRIVLVGVYGLFLTAFAAERQPAHADVVQPVALRRKRQDTGGQRVVEVGDGARQACGGFAVLQQLERQAPDITGGGDHRGLAVDRLQLPVQLRDACVAAGELDAEAQHQYFSRASGTVAAASRACRSVA